MSRSPSKKLGAAFLDLLTLVVQAVSLMVRLVVAVLALLLRAVEKKPAKTLDQQMDRQEVKRLGPSAAMLQAEYALVHMGYKKADVSRVLSRAAASEDVGSLVKEGLRGLAS
jgi:Holliday junction resolvasome RuvABC DNA-binding subunit